MTSDPSLRLGMGSPLTRKLCDPCAKDTAVKGRCEALTGINKPGTICDRCLRDGRLLVSYRICCEPESRFGHTVECKKTRKVSTDPELLRFAVALFSTDARVLAIVEKSYDSANGANTTQFKAQDRYTPVERLGRAWDIAGDGHEPEATYRREAQDRAFRMRQFHRELKGYADESKRLTRESAPASESVGSVSVYPRAGSWSCPRCAKPNPGAIDFRGEECLGCASCRETEATLLALQPLLEAAKERADTRKKEMVRYGQVKRGGRLTETGQFVDLNFYPENDKNLIAGTSKDIVRR